MRRQPQRTLANATHRIYRATRLTEAERAEAAKLVPARATAQTE